jgi:hypothetical protein
MRLIFLILLLTNVALSAYIWLAAGQHADANRIRILEIAPERMKPVARGAALPPKPKPAHAAAHGAACLEWGVFSGPDIARMEAAVAKLDLDQAPAKRALANASGYWVYIPPLKTRAAVERKTGELKELGVNQFFVVDEAGQWRNAISLGIFKSAQAADAYLAALQKQGVHSAIVERRDNFLKQMKLVVREPSGDTIAKLAQAKREFPDTEIRAAACALAGPDSDPVTTSAISAAG